MPKKPHLLTGSGLWKLFTFLGQNRIAKEYRYKLVELIWWNLLLAPLQLLEKLIFASFIKKQTVHPEPLFIIGHWRSGTTFLHYLLSNDTQFGYCSNIDAFAPVANILGRSLIRRILNWRLPPHRPMDNVKLHPDAPQEEEFAMMLLSPHSFYHSFVFPDRMKELFYNYAVLPAENSKLLHEWTNAYYTLLQKLTILSHGKKLLLKNPVNTMRIKQLVHMFPKAKFIYLYRNPFETKHSMHRMVTSLLEINTLQSYNLISLKNMIDEFHKACLKEYELQRALIDPKNLIEVNYEDLKNTPLKVVQRIYDELRLDGFSQSKVAFEKFIEKEHEYKPYEYKKTQEETFEY